MVKKILSCLLIIFLFLLLTTNVYAISLGDIIKDGKDFVNTGSSTNLEQSKLINISGNVYNILLVLSFIINAVIGIILGMKYMMSGVDEKADLKKSLIVYTIGCVVTYGAFGIWKVLVTFLNTL